VTEIRLFDNKLYQQKMSKFIQDLWIIGHMTTLHMYQHEINIVHLAAQIIPIHVTKEGSQTQTGIILLSDDFDRIIIHTRINKDHVRKVIFRNIKLSKKVIFNPTGSFSMLDNRHGSFSCFAFEKIMILRGILFSFYRINYTSFLDKL